MDEAALGALSGDRIDFRYKGFPARFDGLTIAELVAAKPLLADFGTPLLVLDRAALDHNVDLMARFCRRHGVDLAPHGKTTMAPRLFERQLAAGSWGVTAATIAHVRAYRAFGVERIMLANQLIDADALGWAAAELRDAQHFQLFCFADSVAGVELMQAGLVGGDAVRPINVVIDVGAYGGRTGVRTADEAEAVARAVHGADRLRLVGVGGFEGALAADRGAESVEHIRGYLRSLRSIVERLDAARLFDQAEEIIVTAGGSAYFDEVVEILGGAWTASMPVRTVLRSGAYITHDDGHYRRLTPFADPNRAQAGPTDADAEHFVPALSIRGRVVSLPEPGLALLDFGKRDAPVDLGMPEPHTLHRADGGSAPLTGCEIASLADQHAFLHHGAETRLSLGDIVSCGISHPCTAFDKWQLIPIIEGEYVVDVVRTFF